MSTKMQFDVQTIWIKLQGIPVLTVWAVSHSDVSAYLQTGTYFVAFITAIFFGFKTYEQYVTAKNKRYHDEEVYEHERETWEEE